MRNEYSDRPLSSSIRNTVDEVVEKLYVFAIRL